MAARAAGAAPLATLLLIAACGAGGARLARADSAAPASDTSATARVAVPARADTSGERAAADSIASPRADSLPGELRAIGVFGEGSSGGPRLLEPNGVTTDAFGRLTVADAAGHRLVRYQPDGAWLDQTGALGSDPGQLRRPTSVVTLGSTGIAVLDRENRRIVGYDLFGRLVGVLVDLAAPDLESAVGRVDATALAADRGGALYVADADRDRVLAFDFSGHYQRALGGYGTRPGSFRGLAGLACGPRGDLFTTERAGARVQRLDAGGRVVSSWSIPVRPGRAPVPIAASDALRVAVADETAGTLWVFGPDGRLWAARSDLSAPCALAFAPDGTLLVAEAGAGRVRRFALMARPDSSAARGD